MVLLPMSAQLDRIRRSGSPETVFSMPESAFTIAGIHVQDAGLGVQLGSESAFGFGQNRCSEWSGARMYVRGLSTQDVSALYG
jgi:hypothetical protein